MMTIEPIGNSVEVSPIGNKIIVEKFDVRTETEFLAPFMASEEHKAVIYD